MYDGVNVKISGKVSTDTYSVPNEKIIMISTINILEKTGKNKKDNSEEKMVELWHNDEPNSKVVIFKNAGHLVNMDVPEKFNKVVIDFIKQK